MSKFEIGELVIVKRADVFVHLIGKTGYIVKHKGDYPYGENAASVEFLPQNGLDDSVTKVFEACKLELFQKRELREIVFFRVI